MSKDYWFKRRRYGWGWFPVAWQGWAVVLGYLVLLIGSARVLADPSGDRRFSAKAGFFLSFAAIITAVLILISFRKGPRPRWRWGKRPGDNSDEDL